MLSLTVDQHKEVLQQLVNLGERISNGVPDNHLEIGYTSLMVSFLLHNLTAARSIVQLSNSFGDEWFPASVCYTIARTMFEVDVTAHYIAKSPAEHVRQYIDFTAVLNKKEMGACKKNRNSEKPGWQEPMESLWQNYWANRESEIERKYKIVIPQFTRTDKKGKTSVFQNWSGKTILQMASEVDHTEAYDVFYSELSSFAHANVRLADRYLQHRTDGPVWSQKAREFDVGNVFRYAANFLTCHLELFGQQFNTWTETEVSDCWKDTSSRA